MSTHTFPRTMNVTVKCPACRQEFDFTSYPEITIPGNSKLKKKVLNKTLFFPKCPHCGEEFKLRPNCFYRNEIKREMIIVTDRSDTEIENMMKTGDIHFNDIMTDEDTVTFLKGLYIRRVVHDVDAFREKILLSDNNYDDRIIELMKLSLSGLIEKENRAPVYRIFLEETSVNVLEFTAIMGSGPPFEYVGIKTATSVYTQYKNRYQNMLGHPGEDEYISTDQSWALKSGLLKNEDAGFILPF